MVEKADWSELGAYMAEHHHVLGAQANEALADPDRVVITPDYNSRNGETSRIIGFSTSRDELLTVIVHDATGYGVNGWPSNSKDRRLYREGGTS